MNNQDSEESQLFAGISNEISQFHEQTHPHPLPNFGLKSVQWFRSNKLPWTDLILQGPLLEALHYVQGTQLTVNHNKATVEAGLCTEEMIDDLEAAGFQLDQAPPEIKEADFTNPDQILFYKGRPVSVDFLYRLNICQHVSDVINLQDLRILEIGAGVGSMARTIKLVNSTVKYVIIDILDTLVLSYGLLRASFPDASTTFVTNPTQLAQVDGDSDFTFIPAEVVPMGQEGGVGKDQDIPRLDIDLVLNLQSLGEMRQDVAENYIDLIQNRINAKRFFSMNHYLYSEHRVHLLDGAWGTSYCTPMDPHWTVRRWDFSPTIAGRFRMDSQDSTLELYLERTDPNSVDPDTLRRQSAELLAEAQKLGDIRGHRWHHLMWDSIRLCPTKENVEPYFHFLKGSNRHEARYLGNLLVSMGVDVWHLYAEPVPRRGLLAKPGNLLRRLGRRLDRLGRGINRQL